MNLVFNELSINPLSENGHIAENRFRTLLETFKEAKRVYGFKHIRFPNDYAFLQVTPTQTFLEWVSALNNRDIKDLIMSLCKKPYVDELSEAEQDTFFESNYTLIGEDIIEDCKPIGLPVSYIKTMPAISLDSHVFWRNRKISIRKSTHNSTKCIDFIAYNICIKSDIISDEIQEWANLSMPILIDTKERLSQFLGFTIYKVDFMDDFIEQLFIWKTDDFETFKYILLLMKDVQIHPFTGGMGKTENLKGRGKEASKRITNSFPDGDRLSYILENNIVKFIACKGHYKFH